MSPTAGEIAGGCGVDRGRVYQAVASLRSVDPWRFVGLPVTEELVIPIDGREPYEVEVVDYPPSVVALIVQVLANMGSRPGCRDGGLRDFARRYKGEKVDLRRLYDPK